MMMESFFRIEFIPKGPVTEAFNEFVSLLDTKEDLPKYLRRSDKRIKILAESRNFGLRAVVDSDLNNYDYDDGSISLDVSCSVLFNGESSSQQQLEETLNLVRQFYQCLDAKYVFGMHSGRIETIGLPENRNGIRSPITDESLAQNRIVAPTWLMLFPPAMVEEYGREWLLDLPAERIDELDDGAIVIVATTDIFDADSDLAIANTVGKSLRPPEDAFADKH